VHLRKRKFRNSAKSNIKHSLYSDIFYRKGIRKREFLGTYLDPQDTQTNRKDKLELAHRIKAQRMLELTNQEYGFPYKAEVKNEFCGVFRNTDEQQGMKYKDVMEERLHLFELIHLRKYFLCQFR